MFAFAPSISSIRDFAIASLLAVIGATAAGCAAPETEDFAESEAPLASKKTIGIDVRATHTRHVAGTPTYGYDATAPFLSVEVTVSDAKIAQACPSFDGFERPFVLVPRDDGSGGARWERRPLAYERQAFAKKGSLYDVSWEAVGDVHALRNVQLSEADLARALASGVAIGLETNCGTLWAQDAGQNFPVEVEPAR